MKKAGGLSKASLEVAIAFNGVSTGPALKLEREAIPSAPPGYRLVPLAKTQGALWVIGYADLPDGSYVEVRWKRPTGQWTRHVRTCRVCGRTFPSNSALSVHGAIHREPSP